MSEDTHRAKTLGERKGWFSKNMDGNPVGKPYRDNCEGEGYNGPRWEAHHIVPKTSIDQSIEGTPQRPGSPYQLSAESAERQKFIRDLIWITPWNIDDKKNLVGMPHLNSFMMYFQKADFEQNLKLGNQGETGYMAQRIISFNNKTSQQRQDWKDQLGTTGTPEGYCVHQYVNWGHTDYNRKVAISLKQVWDQYQKKKDEHAEDPRKHGIDPNKIKTDLEGESGDFRSYLSTRGKKAKKANWDKRLTSPTWYKNFTMADGWNPLTGATG